MGFNSVFKGLNERTYGLHFNRQVNLV